MCCRPLLKQRTNRARLLPTSKHSLNSAVALLKAIAIVSDTRVLAYQDIEHFHQARLVRITHGRLAIRLDPLGMLDSQVIVNLFPQICVGVGSLKHNH